jgi:CDP-diacylglycerol---glycerol-3-phosphate 3-phosphatidyltransferase
MFDGQFRTQAEKRLRPVGDNLRRTGLTADHLTLIGVLMGIGASVAIGMGALRAGVLLLVLCAVPDVLDGAVAKASGTASPRGAFFDSVSDRVTDAFLLGGMAWFLSTHHPGRIAVLPMAVLAASMLISYERAKADSLGFDARGGLMERAERLILIGFALLFDSLMIPVLWVMLGLTLLTAGQRFVKVWRQASSGVRPLATTRRRTMSRRRATRAARAARGSERRSAWRERLHQRPPRSR